MIHPLYRVTFVSPTLSRRVSFAQSVGIRDDYYDVNFLATAIQIMSKYPDDYPCPQVETMFDFVSEDVILHPVDENHNVYVVKSSVPFKFIKI